MKLIILAAGIGSRLGSITSKEPKALLKIGNTTLIERNIVKLKNAGIQTAIHYPVSLPLLNAYKYLGYTASDFPVSYQYQDEILSLPMYPEMTEEMRNFVLQEIHELFD